VDAIAQQFTQGGITLTGNSLDVAINGNGFFQIQQPDGSMAYSRAGNFKLDKDGNVLTNNNGRLMGYPVDPVSGKALTGTVQPLNFPLGTPIAAKETTEAKISLNLDARVPDATSTTPPTPRSTYGTSITVYDSQGVAHQADLYFVKNGSNNWDVYDKLDDPTATPPVVGAVIGSVTFDANGKLTSGSPLPITITTAPTNPNDPPTDLNISVDLSDSTQFGTKFAVSETTQNGYTSGQLTGMNIGPDGTITTTYSNGVSRPEGVIALATFRNTQGLADIGNNLWVETASSGQPTVGQPTSGAFGALRAGALEESNVDLTAELVNMMTAQRAYQANAQTIKTQDQVMSTIVNLR
jgi:flagellar hook protein FlgE